MPKKMLNREKKDPQDPLYALNREPLSSYLAGTRGQKCRYRTTSNRVQNISEEKEQDHCSWSKPFSLLQILLKCAITVDLNPFSVEDV